MRTDEGSLHVLRSTADLPTIRIVNWDYGMSSPMAYLSTSARNHRVVPRSRCADGAAEPIRKKDSQRLEFTNVATMT